MLGITAFFKQKVSNFGHFYWPLPYPFQVFWKVLGTK